MARAAPPPRAAAPRPPPPPPPPPLPVAAAVKTPDMAAAKPRTALEKMDALLKVRRP